jgi:hypothetical protein
LATGSHQLVAEDLMEDGTISRISNAYSLTHTRKKTTTNIGSWRIAISNCNCNGKMEIKPPVRGEKFFLKNWQLFGPMSIFEMWKKLQCRLFITPSWESLRGVWCPPEVLGDSQVG